MVVQHVAKTTFKMLKPNSSSNVCSTFQIGKSHKLPISYVHKRSQCMFDIFYIDQQGPIVVSSNHSMKIFLFFVDDYSRFQWIYMLHNKELSYKNILLF